MADDTGRDDADQTDEDEDEEDNTTETTSGGDWTPPTKEDWERVQRTNTRLRKENQKRREAAKGNGTTPAEGDDAVKKAVADAVAPIRKGAITTAARLAFKAAGVKDEDPDRQSAKLNRAVRLLDMDSIEFTDGEVHGLDDQIEELQELYPELFGTGKSSGDGKKVTKIDGAPKGGGKAPAKTSADQLAARVLGG